MANWWVVETASNKMIASFDDAGKATCSIGLDQQWLEVPDGVAAGNAKVLDTAGVLTLVDGATDKSSPEWDELRASRDAKLLACDWTQTSDNPMAAAKKTAWATYRTALRDLPGNTEDPSAAVWPTKPV
jgi:hypothetical protein